MTISTIGVTGSRSTGTPTPVVQIDAHEPLHDHFPSRHPRGAKRHRATRRRDRPHSAAPSTAIVRLLDGNATIYAAEPLSGERSLTMRPARQALFRAHCLADPNGGGLLPRAHPPWHSVAQRAAMRLTTAMTEPECSGWPPGIKVLVGPPAVRLQVQHRGNISPSRLSVCSELLPRRGRAS